MTAKEKLAHKRLTLLQLAEKLGNVSKACRMHKVTAHQLFTAQPFGGHFAQDAIDEIIGYTIGRAKRLFREKG